jgi:homocysteine S-methyltransferase
METWLIFDQGFELPCFAGFPLLESAAGRAALERYFEPYLELARRHEIGFVLEAATWRASPAWGRQLGYSLDALADVNRQAVGFIEQLRDREQPTDRALLLNAPIGPESDAYHPDHRLSADVAEAYHAWQIGVLADTPVDLVTGLTITYAEEAIGIVQAAKAAGLPVAISFTVETDGRLPSGQPLGEAIGQVDAATRSAAAYYMVNCAHPTHFETVFAAPGPWHRVLGIRANASKQSHLELDEATELDDGDPTELAADYLRLGERLPHLTVLGGCCGTDHRHVASVIDAWLR